MLKINFWKLSASLSCGDKEGEGAAKQYTKELKLMQFPVDFLSVPTYGARKIITAQEIKSNWRRFLRGEQVTENILQQDIG